VRLQHALGTVALCAVVLAAVCFAAVDVTVGRAIAGGTPVPEFPVVCAVAGAVALVAAIPPAVGWIVAAIRHAQHDRRPHPVRIGTLHRVYGEDEA